MADKQIRQLTSDTTLDGSELVPFQEAAGGTGSTKQTTTQAIADLGGGSAGSPVVRKFAFAYNTANILTGHTVYTPTIGDVLLDVWIQIDTVWDGTTPKADVGTFVGSTTGLFDWTGSRVLLDSSSGGAFAEPAGTGIAFGNTNGNDKIYALSHTQSQASEDLPAIFTAANPIKIVVSQNGTVGGSDPGASQGSGVLYLITATPV